jgi:hypothetical protein
MDNDNFKRRSRTNVNNNDGTIQMSLTMEVVRTSRPVSR